MKLFGTEVDSHTHTHTYHPHQTSQKSAKIWSFPTSSKLTLALSFGSSAVTLKTLASLALHRPFGTASATAAVVSPASGQAIRGGDREDRGSPGGSDTAGGIPASAQRWVTPMQLSHWKLQNVDAMGVIILFKKRLGSWVFFF